MLTSLIKKLALMLTLSVGFGFTSCEKEEPAVKKEVDNKYRQWKTYTYRKIKIYYPAGHPLEDGFYDLTRNYIAAIKKDCQLLNINVPEDTLIIYFYTGLGQGKEMTGQPYPFADSKSIHFWLPGYYGTSLMKYLIPKWQKKEPQFQFLKHGLMALLDNAGKNYHKATLNFVDRGKLIPLSQLAVDMTINSDDERYQSALAASFVDFILFYYRIEALNLLYTSQLSFDLTVQKIFSISVDSLQSLWLTAIKRGGQRVEHKRLS